MKRKRIEHCLQCGRDITKRRSNAKYCQRCSRERQREKSRRVCRENREKYQANTGNGATPMERILHAQEKLLKKKKNTHGIQ